MTGNLTIAATDPTITLRDSSGANTDPNGTIIFSEIAGTTNFDINYNGANDRLEFRGLISSALTDLVHIKRNSTDAVEVFGNVTASSLIKSGGSSSEFLKADGSVDSSTYLTSLGTAIVDGDFTVNGLMKRTGAGTYTSITDNSSNWNTAYTHTSATNNPHSVTASQVGASPTAGSTSLTTVGTIGTGTWQGSVIASAYLDTDTAHLSGTQTFTGAKTFGNITSSGGYKANIAESSDADNITSNNIKYGYLANAASNKPVSGNSQYASVGNITLTHYDAASNDDFYIRGKAYNGNTSWAKIFTDQNSAFAPLASPALTGNPTAPTQSSSENSTKIATTAYVKSQGYLTSYTETDTLATVTGRGRTTSTSGSAVWSATTQGTTQGSMHLMSITSDHAGGAITFDASDSNGAQAGIYVKSDGSYGTKMYLSTTDSYASGSKSAISINHQGYVNIVRGNDRLTVNGNAVFHDGYHPNADILTTTRNIALSGDVTGNVDFNGSADVSITTALAANSVGATEIATNAVGSSEIAANAVTASEIAASAVGASELNVSGNGTTAQFLRSDGDGTFTWATPTDTNTVYSHPTHAGDDINIDTGALTGATVISDLDFNVTTDGLGHVTDANGTVSTRTLTAANLGISAPNAPASASAAIVGETVEVTFAASTTSNIDAYLVYSSIDGSDYGLISIVPPDDFAASMSIIDNAFDETGTQAYRVYAVKYGILSSATTASVSYTVSSAEPTTMSVVNLNNAYYVQWNPPSSNARFVTAYNVYKHEHATQGSLSRSSASLVYSGMNTNFMYQISGSNNNNFHQFWVETTIA